ncbi:MAG: phytanoyl-CoA dioxygenase family protein [Pirellulales bacterium]
MTATDRAWQVQLAEAGWCFLPATLSTRETAAAADDCEAALAAAAAADSVLTSGRGAAYGARNLLRVWPQVLRLAEWPPLNAALRQTLGPQAGLVRGLFFDKPPGASWSLPWHRDQTIAVRRHVESQRFHKPTVKAGTPHVQAPPDLLEQMLTARIHLDAMTRANGPLRVIAGSHQTLAEPGDCAGEQTELHCPAGSVLLMRPLLLHASSQSAEDAGRRRIVHLEFAPRPTLEDGFEWHDFVPI